MQIVRRQRLSDRRADFLKDGFQVSALQSYDFPAFVDPEHFALHFRSVSRPHGEPILFSRHATSAIPMSPRDPPNQAVSLPCRRFPDVGAGDRVWQLRVPQAVGPDMAREVCVLL